MCGSFILLGLLYLLMLSLGIEPFLAFLILIGIIMASRCWVSGVSPGSHYLYVMTMGDCLYKIGVSTDVKRRVKTFQTGNPKIRLVAISKPMSKVTAYQQEKSWHKRFAICRVSGEWYQLTRHQLGRLVE